MQKLLYTIPLLFLLGACQSPPAAETFLRNGYRYTNHTNFPGPKPIIGKVMTIDFEIVDQFGNILSDSRKAAVRPSIQIPEQMNRQMKRNPLLSLVEQMAVGDSATVFVPVDSLSSPPQEFLQSKIVEYRVVMLTLESQDEYMKRVGFEESKLKEDSFAEAKDAFDKYMAGDYDKITVEKNGSVKLAIVDNTNGLKADYNELVFVHYYGFFKDGRSFDNSYKVGKPYGFRIGKGGVIRGWDIAIPDIPEGASAILEIPFTMAYGIEGNPGIIPPRTDLYYWVKIDKIEKSEPKKN
jgi:FKBP-type peptidyl-prolyl cis-trans isomerase